MTDKRSRNEHIKDASRQLRGTIADGLTQAVTGGIAEDDQQLVKFHGTYLQDDRDIRAERSRQRGSRRYAGDFDCEQGRRWQGQHDDCRSAWAGDG